MESYTQQNIVQLQSGNSKYSNSLFAALKSLLVFTVYI